jgi:hypothetical protein
MAASDENQQHSGKTVQATRGFDNRWLRSS